MVCLINLLYLQYIDIVRFALGQTSNLLKSSPSLWTLSIKSGTFVQLPLEWLCVCDLVNLLVLSVRYANNITVASLSIQWSFEDTDCCTWSGRICSRGQWTVCISIYHLRQSRVYSSTKSEVRWTEVFCKGMLFFLLYLFICSQHLLF